jgi:SAM-dependent methyltransferase
LVARREKLEIATVEGDMADLGSFPDGCFALIIHPVSNVFVPEVRPVWKEAFRVLRPGGMLAAGFMNPATYIFDFAEWERTGKLEARYSLPYSDIEQLPPDELLRYGQEGIPLEFSHTLEEQIGGQVNAGFRITGLYEDQDREGDYNPFRNYMPRYIATRAEKPQRGLAANIQTS